MRSSCRPFYALWCFVMWRVLQNAFCCSKRVCCAIRPGLVLLCFFKILFKCPAPRWRGRGCSFCPTLLSFRSPFGCCYQISTLSVTRPSLSRMKPCLPFLSFFSLCKMCLIKQDVFLSDGNWNSVVWVVVASLKRIPLVVKKKRQGGDCRFAFYLLSENVLGQILRMS